MKKRSIAALLLACLLLCCACASSKRADHAAPAAEAPAAVEEAYDRDFYGEQAAAGAYDAGAVYATAQSTNAAAPAETADGQPADQSIRKIIYNADMDVTAEDPGVALSALMERAEELGGYVADSYERTDELGAYRCTATLKVPAEKLDELVAAAEGVGKVDSYRLYSDDISLAYYDIQARLKSAKAEEAQLLEILSKCETVEDVLAVRESLSRVRSDIESYQGQINLWDNLVSYATLSLNIARTPRAAVEGESELLTIWKASDVWKRMSFGFANSARFLVNAVGAVGIFLAYAVLPVGVVALIVIGIRTLLQKTKPAREAKRAKRLEIKAQKAAEKLEKKRNRADKQ